jgi:hypothetical protein
MKKNMRSMHISCGTSLLLVIATITIPLVLTFIPIKGYAALCAKPDKSTTYFNGYDAAQSDFRNGRPQNQTITSANSQYNPDYKQGYKDGWNDAQYNVNIIQNSIC